MTRQQPPYLLVGLITLALCFAICGGIPAMLLMVSSPSTKTEPAPVSVVPPQPKDSERKLTPALIAPRPEVQSAAEIAAEPTSSVEVSHSSTDPKQSLVLSLMQEEDLSIKTPAIREWTAKTGGFRVVAKCMAYADGVAVLEREDGKSIKVPVDKISFTDLQYVKDLIRVHPKANITIGKIESVSGKYDLMFKDEADSKIVRLYAVAFPEPDHPFYSQAREALKTKLIGKAGWIEWFEQTNEGYPLVMLYLNGRCANLEFIAEGFAWHDNRNDNSSRFANAETVAREKRFGLWSTHVVTRPWETALSK